MVNLAWIDIDGTVDEHIVASPQYPVVLRKWRPAGTVMIKQTCHVVGTITDQRAGLFTERGNHQFPHLPGGNRFECFRIDNFIDKQIRPVMDTGMVFTIQSGPRTIYFGQSINIEYVVHVHELLNPGSHGITVALCAQNYFFDFYFPGYIPFLYLLCHQQRHGCGGTKYGGLHIHHHFTVHVRIGRTQWNGNGAESFTACLKSNPCRPQTVSDGYLHTILSLQAGHFITPCEHIGPYIDIFLGVAEDFAFTGCPRGGMNADDIAIVNGPERKGIPLLQILLIGKRKITDIFQGLDIFRFKPDGIEFFTVMRRMPVTM